MNNTQFEFLTKGFIKHDKNPIEQMKVSFFQRQMIIPPLVEGVGNTASVRPWFTIIVGGFTAQSHYSNDSIIQ